MADLHVCTFPFLARDAPDVYPEDHRLMISKGELFVVGECLPDGEFVRILSPRAGALWARADLLFTNARRVR